MKAVRVHRDDRPPAPETVPDPELDALEGQWARIRGRGILVP